jgi:peptidoglycan/LPS O-acetylase OafA/YrhL
LAIVATITYRLVVFAWVPDLSQRVFYTNQMFGVLDGFMMGTAIAIWHSDAKNVSEVQADHFFSLPTLLILSGIATLIVALAVLNANAAAFWERPVVVGGFRTLVGVAFALLVLGAVQLPHTLRVPRPMRFLGDISYGIYLWHYLLLLWLQKSFDLAAAPLVLMTLFTTLSAAVMTFFLIEAPFQRLAKKITARPR